MMPANSISGALFLMMMELIVVFKSHRRFRTKVLESRLMYHHVPL